MRRKNFPPPPILLLLILDQIYFTAPKSLLDCAFDHLSNSQDSGFCQWQPSSRQEGAGAQLWHTGNAVLVDSANSVIRSPSQPFSYPFKSKNGGALPNNRFAYVQGQGAKGPTEGAIQSPLLEAEDGMVEHQDLKFSYWKANASPTLDICIKYNADEELRCIDSIQGPGQNQWIRRAVELPLNELPFRVVFRARNVVSAEDIVCIDDVQLVTSFKGVSDRGDFRRSRDDQFVEGHVRQEEEGGAEYTASQGLVPLMQMNNFGMQPSPPPVAPIKSQLPVFLHSKSVDTPEKRMNMMQSAPITPPIINPLSQMNALPFAKSKQIPNTSMFVKPPSSNTVFPEFPSFSEGLHPTGNEKPLLAESTAFCKAIKCSFLDHTCLWKLGPTWKPSDGNIAKDSAGEDSVTSAQFKAPLASFVEFDLWMSDDSHLMVLEELDAAHEEDEEIMLPTMAGTVFECLCALLPPSPGQVPQHLTYQSFITLSNTRLVNGDGEELACETVFHSEKEEDPVHPGIEHSSSWQGTAPLLGNPWQNHLQRQQPQSGFAFSPTIDMGVPPIEELAANLNTPANNIFRLKDLRPPEANTKTKGKTLGELIGIVAGQPVLEQQLRLLAQHLGFDANSTPDAQTLETLKRFLGTRLLPGKGLLGQLPSSVTSAVSQNGSVPVSSARSALSHHHPLRNTWLVFL
uniref:MAM domain-containing protein n=1 Tax=Ditylenchus dipsaci TaxID=166011 RepID=A0A915EJ03_9BILA